MAFRLKSVKRASRGIGSLFGRKRRGSVTVAPNTPPESNPFIARISNRRGF